MGFIKTQEGVVVDARGAYVGRLKWDEADPTPTGRALKRRADHKGRLTLLTDPEAIKGVTQNGRWDFEAQAWVSPARRVVLVDSQGRGVGSIAYNDDDDVRIPPGLDPVEVDTVRKRGRKRIYDGTGWVDPRVVCIVNSARVVVNMALENPRADTENTPVPDGHIRILVDTLIDSEGVGIGWTITGRGQNRRATPPAEETA